MRVSVVGGSRPPEDAVDVARELGRLLARRGHDVVCGGRSGVMEAVCRGATEEGGRSIGILPSAEWEDANPYVDVSVATGMGDARNALVVLNGDAVVAVDGSHGTLSEIAHALALGLPVAGLDTHDVGGVVDCDGPREAVDYVEDAVES
ncbi:MAG: TIGR00725 family protein [Halobacteriota archaeon]